MDIFGWEVEGAMEAYSRVSTSRDSYLLCIYI